MLALPVQTALEEAKALILQSILEAKKARLLEIALRTHSMAAHVAGNEQDAMELQRAADDLAEAFGQPAKFEAMPSD